MNSLGIESVLPFLPTLRHLDSLLDLEASFIQVLKPIMKLRSSCGVRVNSSAEVCKDVEATVNPTCNVCKMAFSSPIAAQDHQSAVHDNNRCPQCDGIFTTWTALTRHQREQNHCFCGDCNKIFGSDSLFKSHLKSMKHSTEFRCCDCSRNFKSSNALYQHLADKVHQAPGATRQKNKKKVFGEKDKVQSTGHTQGSPSTVPGREECDICFRTFKDKEALEQHASSLKHKPLAQLSCITGASCRGKFPSPSALLHHLESGKCKSGMNYETLKEIIIQQDTERLITKPPMHPVQDMLFSVNQRLLSSRKTTNSVDSASNDTDSELGAVILTPASGETPSGFSSGGGDVWTPEDGSVADWAMLLSQSLSPQNRCPFCPPTRRPFSKASALRDHLRSKAHAVPFVFCPADLADGKEKAARRVRAFTTMGGLAQHLESNVCFGGMKAFQKTLGGLEKRLMMLGLGFASAAGSLELTSHENDLNHNRVPC